jgi:YwiC-like protein
MRNELDSGQAGFPSDSNRSIPMRFLVPREHGAWGMVSLSFVAGALVSGSWASLRTLAAAVAVVSVFLLRPPLLVLWRSRNADRRAVSNARAEELRNAWFSLAVSGAAALAAGIYLFRSLPAIPLLLMGCGAVVLTLATVFLAARNYQRLPALQIASAVGLTASSLVAYLAAQGHLASMAYWVWALFAAHSAASVLVVHARLESIVAGRRAVTAHPVLPHRRNALVAQVGLVVLLVVLVIHGRPWLVLPFLPACLLGWWDLWQLRAGAPGRISLRRIGLMQLGASIVFCFLLIAILRLSL